MKKLFFPATLLFILFELANVYFIMPMPGGSQEINSIDLAYFLHANRWIIRGILGLAILISFPAAWKWSKWISISVLLILGVVIYMTQYKMAADTMFYQPKYVSLLPADKNEVSLDRIILGVEHNGEAKAYPIQFLGYHHQVRDTIGGKPIMVTYCTVCRTGRVFEPVVNGRLETFRLVGMDHYNAMFEDFTTKSWWRQETGIAIAGPLKDQALPEFMHTQTTLETWLQLHPHSLIMQPDSNFTEIYEQMSDYEAGRKEGRLTRRDTTSWDDKSWIAGIVVGEKSKAYDWNQLTNDRIINDKIGAFPIAIVLAHDNQSLFAFHRTAESQQLSFRNDTLTDGVTDYNFLGMSFDTLHTDLQPILVYQEYWHSWQTFHPTTEK